MLTDLNTYLNKAIPDTRLTIKKYLDVKFEYLVSGCRLWGHGSGLRGGSLPGGGPASVGRTVASRTGLEPVTSDGGCGTGAWGGAGGLAAA